MIALIVFAAVRMGAGITASYVISMLARDVLALADRDASPNATQVQSVADLVN